MTQTGQTTILLKVAQTYTCTVNTDVNANVKSSREKLTGRADEKHSCHHQKSGEWIFYVRQSCTHPQLVPTPKLRPFGYRTFLVSTSGRSSKTVVKRDVRSGESICSVSVNAVRVSRCLVKSPTPAASFKWQVAVAAARGSLRQWGGSL